MDALTLAVQFANGLQYGLVLFLLASGLTLVFGVLGVVNLAHGMFYMLGAYLAYGLTRQTGSFWIALAAGVPIAFAGGWALERLYVKRFYGRDHLAQVLLSYGLILVLDELRHIVFGKDVHAVPVPELLQGSIRLSDVHAYPIYRLAVCAFCLAVAAAIFVVVHRTRLGMIVRAGAENREMSRVLGIRVEAVNRWVFAIGIMLAALAGIVTAPLSTVYPGMSDQVLILSFVVVVLGGIGSIAGAAFGALTVGMADTFGKVFFPQVASLSVYAVMAAVLIWRPHGLFGRRVP